jgi:hypothetical protein
MWCNFALSIAFVVLITGVSVIQSVPTCRTFFFNTRANHVDGCYISMRTKLCVIVFECLLICCTFTCMSLNSGVYMQIYFSSFPLTQCPELISQPDITAYEDVMDEMFSFPLSLHFFQNLMLSRFVYVWR